MFVAERAGYHHLIRIAAAVFLLGCAALIFGAGEFAPRWIWSLAKFGGMTPPSALRALAALLAGFALSSIAVGSWSTRSATVGLGLAVFASLATVSSAIRGPTPTLVVAAITAAIGCALLVGLRAGPPRKPATRTSDAWRVMALIMLFTTSFAVSARMPLRDRSASSTTSEPADARADSASAVDLAINTWEGKRLEDTGLFDHLPALRTMLQSSSGSSQNEIPTYLIFYNTRCGHCHRGSN